MIGLVGVLAPPGDGAGTACLDSLPHPPALSLAAAAVQCSHGLEVDTILEWFGEMRAKRPAFPMMLVADQTCAAQLASFPHPVVGMVSPSELQAGGLPRTALERLRAASVEGRVLDRLVLRFGRKLLQESSIVRCLIAHAVRGGTVAAAARDVGVSCDTIRRRLAVVGLRPRELIRAARILAYEERRLQGASPPVALCACGWNDPEHLRRARRRDQAAGNRGS